VDCCGKIFCKLCIETANERFGKCPNCRGTANSFVDRRSARQIKALKISCKNEEKGCSWVGRLEDYEKHIEECKLEEVTPLEFKQTGYALKYSVDQHDVTLVRVTLSA